MTETNFIESSVILGRAPAERARGVLVRGPILVARWALVVAATLLWLVIVPVVAFVAERRRGDVDC